MKTLLPWRRSEPSRRFGSLDLPDLFGRLFENGDLEPVHLPEAFRRGPVPPMNVSENEKDYTVTLDAPGLEENDFDIQLMGGRLIISGERRWREEKKEKEYVRVESQYGSFSRSIDLPDGAGTDTDQIRATYDKGVLKVVVPKAEPTPTTRIPVAKG